MLRKQIGFILLILFAVCLTSCSESSKSSTSSIKRESSSFSETSKSSLEESIRESSSNLESSSVNSEPSSSSESSSKEEGISLASGIYNLAWSDEFDYEGSLDDTKWGYDLGSENGGWGNNERQYYTNRLDNVSVDNGQLTIKAKKESYNGYQYTSARIVTKNKADFTYGYFEVKAKLPYGIGTWPAIWLLPTDNVYGGWPNSGEIDMMEMVGSRPNHVLGSIHTRDYNWYNGITVSKGGSTDVDTGITGFNTYGIEWTEDYISFYVNGESYYTFANNNSGDYKQWPFDQDFHLILNIAMGGTLGGTISSTFVESSMVVDYVRVYKLK